MAKPKFYGVEAAPKVVNRKRVIIENSMTPEQLARYVSRRGSGIHRDRRNKRIRTRSNQKANAVSDSS